TIEPQHITLLAFGYDHHRLDRHTLPLTLHIRYATLLMPDGGGHEGVIGGRAHRGYPRLALMRCILCALSTSLHRHGVHQGNRRSAPLDALVKALRTISA